MGKTYREYSPRQSLLLPQSPLDWLPEGHLAYWILDVVRELDLQPILDHYERELRGYPPYHPQMMVGLLLYGYCVGVPSSRQIERKTYEDVAFRVVAGGQHPDHTAISEFRRIHLDKLAALFVRVLELCREAGLVKLGVVAIDGTKVKANASKHKAMSYKRMGEKESELKDKIRSLLNRAEQIDADEDATYGKGRRGDELPEELRDAKQRLKRIREAKAALEAEAKARADEKDRPPDDPPPSADELPSHRVPTTADGRPKPKAQRNFTDPESRIQKTRDGFIQGYNCQFAVEGSHQIVVAQAVTNQPPDVEHLVPLVKQIERNTGDRPRIVLADAGYYSDANVRACSGLGIEALMPTERTRHGPPPPAPRGRAPANLDPKQRMARKLSTRRGADLYAKRKTIVEPVFGQVKDARGLRQFLMRGLDKVRGEWALIAATHNLLKLFRAGWAPA